MKRLDIKIENLVRLIENDDSVCFVEESPMKQVISYFARKEKSSDCFTFKNGLVNGINAFLRKAHKIGEGQYGVCYERFGLVFKISKDFLFYHYWRFL